MIMFDCFIKFSIVSKSDFPVLSADIFSIYTVLVKFWDISSKTIKFLVSSSRGNKITWVWNDGSIIIRLQSPNSFLLEGPALLSWCQMRTLVISNTFCLTSVYQSFFFNEISCKERFRGRRYNSFYGPCNKKKMVAYCFACYFEDFLSL